MQEYFKQIYDFMVAHDFPTLMESIRQLEWSHVAKNVYTWLIILPLLIFLLWRKKIKIIISLVSCVLFLLLIQKTLSPAEETLAIHDLLVFLGGAVALIGINLYLLFIRE